MRYLAVACALALLFVAPAVAQTACAAAPVPTWTVLYFERWQDALAKIATNDAYTNSAALLPVRSATKNGYIVTFEKWIEFTNDCPPQPVANGEQDSAGWHRQVLDSPALAESFVAGLTRGTPVVLSNLYVGYAAGSEGSSNRRRAVPHEASFSPRAVVVVWFDATTP